LLFIVYIVLLKNFHFYSSYWFSIIVVNILFHMLTVLLVVYITILLFYCIFLKNILFCGTWEFLTLFVDYSCSTTWSIHTLARLIYYYSLSCCYCLDSYYFLYNYKKLTFLWHLVISNCCCLLFILFYLKLIHSYTSYWFTIIVVNILVHILIVLLVVYIPQYYFTVNF
jgi:hypothetical protein